MKPTTLKALNPVILVKNMKETRRLQPKPWGSKDFGLYDPNGAALVFYEDL